ncbi:MAG: hypothetical protein CSA52_00080 [Gammaproteobacteria bacterium]|nr:MAG: hypothetical protein CSA52_00080 [Gammaproteobacteria bacterium]
MINCWKNCLVLVCLCLSGGSALADTVTIRADEWYPFNGVPDSESPGFMIEIAARALAKGGHRVDYQNMPWERAVNAVQNGRIDCIVGTRKGSLDLVYPEEAQGIEDTAFYAIPGKKWTLDKKHLMANKMAVIGGYSYDEGMLDAHIAAQSGKGLVHVSKGADALDKNIKMLLAGRVDIVAESPFVMLAKLAETGKTGKVVEVARMNKPYDLYVACSPVKPSSKEYARLLTDGTRALRDSGELKVILDKYGLEDWK